MAVAALSKLIGLVIMDGWTQLRISQKPLRSCGFVLLLAWVAHNPGQRVTDKIYYLFIYQKCLPFKAED